MKDMRLFSLDVLRGADMILLTVVGPLVKAAQGGWKCLPPALFGCFKHSRWEGFTLWDLVMPLFIFMCGAAIPFALERRLNAGRAAFWRHVLGRVVLLWILGGLIQGNWLALDPLRFSPFSNALQFIAVGYLVTAAIMVTGSRFLSAAAPVFFAVLYTVALALGGDYSMFGNLAFRVDHAILQTLLPEKNIWVANPTRYAWLLPSLMVAAITLAGYHSTRLLRSGLAKRRKFILLSVGGVVLMAVGLLAELRIPCIKPIFTLSYTLQATGWCVLSLALLYLVNDILMFRWGTGSFLLFGRCSLAAYVTAELFRPVLRAGAHLFADGILSYLPKSAEPFTVEFVLVVELIAVLVFWRRYKYKVVQ